MVHLDVLVIGGGTAGEYAAGYSMGDGRSVGLAERTAVGGSCIFNACIPTKALVHAARTYRKLKHADFYGLPTVTEAAQYHRVKAFKDGIVERIATGRDKRWVNRGVQVFKGVARFQSAREVVVGDDAIHAEKILITTGSSPAAPPIPGLATTGFITNIEAMELGQLPERVVIIGGGAVGVEFSQILSTFGAEVHIVEMMDHLLAAEDMDVSSAIEESLGEDGIAVHTSVKVNEVKTSVSGKVVSVETADGKKKDLECDEILVATGRKPNIEDLDLAAAGVEFTRRGITVDASLQTSVPHIWAAGDVTGAHLFTYVAGEQGKTAALNATTGATTELDYRVLPRSTFCTPEVASVGLTEKQAMEDGHKVKVGRFNYADLTRSIVTGESTGFIKVVVDEETGRLLGGHIVGSEASTMIHEVAVAMATGATASQVGNMLHSYPTLSEGVRYACQAAA